MPDKTAALPAAPISAPLPDSERIVSLDVLRGVAVLGILAMNIRNFGLPIAEFDNPRHALPDGELPAWDFWSWALTDIFCEDKMIALFSMLFGAGVVVFADRLAATGRSALLHFRRMFWLLAIGLVHAYLLWYGDILNTYAFCGMVFWPLRRFRAPLLIGLGVVVLMISVWTRVGPPMARTLEQERGQPVAQREPSATRVIMQRAMRGEEAAYRGSYTDLFRWRADMNTAWHFLAGASFSLWRSGGYMLIGMGLLRLGVLNASRRASTYWGLMLAGYGVGLSLELLGFYPQLIEVLKRGPELTGPGARVADLLAGQMKFIGAAAVALGHLGLVMLLCRALDGGRALAPLAATGRMALSNYLMQTLICITVFDGWAMGRWSAWTMGELYLLVLGIWVLQLVLSPLWLSRFQFGPAEWAWRSLTYWHAQPWRRAPAVPRGE